MRRRLLVILVRVTLASLLWVLFHTVTIVSVDSSNLLRGAIAGSIFGLLMSLVFWGSQRRGVRMQTGNPSDEDYELRHSREVVIPIDGEHARASAYDALGTLPRLAIIDPVDARAGIVARSWMLRPWRMFGISTLILVGVGIVVGNIWFLGTIVIFWWIPELGLAQRVTIFIEERSAYETLVRIDSRPANPLAVVDYGRNLATVTYLSHYLERAR
jgi:hypothetical protein